MLKNGEDIIANESDETVGACQWDCAYPISGDILRVRKDGKWYFADKDGTLSLRCHMREEDYYGTPAYMEILDIEGLIQNVVQDYLEKPLDDGEMIRCLYSLASDFCWNIEDVDISHCLRKTLETFVFSLWEKNLSLTKRELLLKVILDFGLQKSYERIMGNITAPDVYDTETKLLLEEVLHTNGMDIAWCSRATQYKKMTERCVQSSISGMNLTWEIQENTLFIRSGAEDRSWENCEEEIHTIVIEPGITSIKNLHDSIFRCVTKIIIPDSVTLIEEGAFSWLENLREIIVADGNQHYSSDGGVLFSKNKDTLLYAPPKISGIFTIPKCVTTIEKYAFTRCADLERINIPDSVTEIGEYAFTECTNLTSIAIPAGVTEIRERTFFGCKGLTYIQIPDSVTSIGERTFQGCHGLTSIVLPSSITEIDEYAFHECCGLIDITIPGSVMKIGEGAFLDCIGMTNVVLLYGITEIEKCAFAGCSGLMDITIPSSVMKIGRGAFRDCVGLTNVVLPYGITEIEPYAFAGCSGLTDIVIPDSVKSIGTHAFRDCTGLTSIDFSSGVDRINPWTFAGCTGLKEFTIPSSVSRIRNHTFSDCSELINITIPDSVRRIENRAFFGCMKLSPTVIRQIEKIQRKNHMRTL